MRASGVSPVHHSCSLQPPVEFWHPEHGWLERTTVCHGPSVTVVHLRAGRVISAEQYASIVGPCWFRLSTCVQCDRQCNIAFSNLCRRCRAWVQDIQAASTHNVHLGALVLAYLGTPGLGDDGADASNEPQPQKQPPRPGASDFAWVRTRGHRLRRA